MHYLDRPGGIADGDAVFWYIPYNYRADADNRIASNSLALQYLHARAELAAFADMDVA